MSIRIKNLLKNLSAGTFYQIILFIVGFVMPRAILNNYGYELFGLTQSITQIINYIMLVEAGLGIASIQALYKPLSKKDTVEINNILYKTKRDYIFSGLVYIIVLVIITFLYPLIIKENIEYYYILLIVFVMGIPGSIELVLHGKYRVILTANQKVSYVTFIQTIAIILGTVLKLVLISLKVNIVYVLAVSSLQILFRVLVLKNIFKKNYKGLTFNIKTSNTVLGKRKYVVIHQLGSLVLSSSQIILITVFLSLEKVSIFSVYNLVFSSILILLTSTFSKSITSIIGNLVNSVDKLSWISKFKHIETIYYIITFTIYFAAIILIEPFVSLYTLGESNITFNNFYLGILFVIGGIINTLRIPDLTLINAMGLFRETIKPAIIEISLGIIFGVIGIYYFGLIGVLLGFLISSLYRSIQMILYSKKFILGIKMNITGMKIFVNSAIFIILYILLNNISIYSWQSWLIWGSITTFGYASIALIINLILFKDFRFYIINYISILLKRE